MSLWNAPDATIIVDAALDSCCIAKAGDKHHIEN